MLAVVKLPASTKCVFPLVSVPSPCREGKVGVSGEKAALARGKWPAHRSVLAASANNLTSGLLTCNFRVGFALAFGLTKATTPPA